MQWEITSHKNSIHYYLLYYYIFAFGNFNLNIKTIIWFISDSLEEKHPIYSSKCITELIEIIKYYYEYI